VKPDYYEILEISRQASLAEVKSAYRKMALKYHPDRNPSHEGEESFKAASEATPDSKGGGFTVLPTSPTSLAIFPISLKIFLDFPRAGGGVGRGAATISNTTSL
jgi:hypothetical protein